MKTLLTNGQVVNVFTGEIQTENILIEEDIIAGVGNEYTAEDADAVIDLDGQYVFPGLIDGHIHIESTMLMPAELIKVLLRHGTTAIVADPHEIANVAGVDGIVWMMQVTKDLPLDVWFMLPSCVPASPLEQPHAPLKADDIRFLYDHPNVLGLAEMMNYPGVLKNDPDVMQKITDAKERNKIINGHAPLLRGKDLDTYIKAGISDDHECSQLEEAKERIRKGQWVMIRQGTAARNLEGLIGLFDNPWNSRCLLVTDDKHPEQLLEEGHINSSIARAAAMGKDPIAGIMMATLHAAQCFGLKNTGAIAPGYHADLAAAPDLHQMNISWVMKNGKTVFENGETVPFPTPPAEAKLEAAVRHSMHMDKVSAEDFQLPLRGKQTVRVIGLQSGQLLTKALEMDLDLNTNDGVDLEKDIIRLSMFERHHHTGQHFHGFVQGLQICSGAIASSIGHDSHNVLTAGTNTEDLALAVNTLIDMEGGIAVVRSGKVLAGLSLPIGGLMSDAPYEQTAAAMNEIEAALTDLGVQEGMDPFMILSFLSLSVIPDLKISPSGYVDVRQGQIVSLAAD